MIEDISKLVFIEFGRIVRAIIMWDPGDRIQRQGVTHRSLVRRSSE